MIFIDFETRSEISVKDVGATYYAKHESTFPLCMAYAKDDQEVSLLAGNDFECSFDFENDWVVAHNVGFEKSIIKYCLHHWTQPKKWIDTSALCRLAGLPGGLGEAAKILGLREQKDPRGRALVKALTMPRKVTKKNPDMWNNDPDLFNELYAYCMQDVETMRALYNALPKFTKSEFKIWTYNREMNERGIGIDHKLATKALALANEEKEKAIVELSQITGGVITTPNQVKRIADYCGIDSASANAIADTLKHSDLDPTVRRVLEIRQELGKSSIAKLETALIRFDTDDRRIKDLLIYHGASTGRETGSGFQPLNLPRGKIKTIGEIEECIQWIINGDRDSLKAKYKSTLNAISYCLRSIIIPAKGKRFLCADLNAIEARLVFWFADEFRALEAFRQKVDIYKIMASRIYNKPVSAITQEERFVGKTAILGLGYGMGVDKFKGTCEGYGIPVPESVADKAVNSYRNIYAKVKRFWYQLERAAKNAVASGDESQAGKITYSIETKGNLHWLCAAMPSGRKLKYFDPKIDHEGMLSYRGIEKGHFTKLHTYGGKLLENVVQATSRDLLWELVANLKAAHYTPVLTIYDEILCENSNGTLDEMNSIMSVTPQWLDGLPLSVEGWEGNRYRKG